MAFQRTLHHVPDAMLAQVVADFESEGAIVVTIPEGNGKSTVVATFP
jgi:energy-coupling factor transporter ATP-binding protein EcfA2